jgi:dodecin
MNRHIEIEFFVSNSALAKYIKLYNAYTLTILGVVAMGDVYKIIELVGTSASSWEDAVKTVVETASKTLQDLRIAEVKELDVRLENGKVAEYRAKVRLSFKYQKDSD